MAPLTYLPASLRDRFDIPPGAEPSDLLPSEFIKDVRRALRSLLWIIGFIVLLIGLGLSAFATVVWPVKYDFVDPFWIFYTGIVGFLIPLHGARSLWFERQAGRLEIISVAGMEPQNLVWGKWLSMVSFIFLVTCAALPFLALRYFAQRDLIYELVKLGVVAIGGAHCAMFALWVASLRARWLVLLAGFPLLLGAFYAMMLTSFVPLWDLGGPYTRGPGVIGAFACLACVAVMGIPSLFAWNSYVAYQIASRSARNSGYDLLMLNLAMFGIPLLNAISMVSGISAGITVYPLAGATFVMGAISAMMPPPYLAMGPPPTLRHIQSK